MEVIFTQGAIDDLSDMKQSLKPDLWKIVKNQIHGKAQFIRDNSLAQPFVPELEDINPNFRQGLTSHYRIIYEMTEEKIYIYVICHQSRDLKAVLYRRLSLQRY